MDCSPPGSSVHRDSPSKNTGMGFHSLLQGIFLTQGLNPDLQHCRQILQCLSHQLKCIYRVWSLAQEHLLQYSLASLVTHSVKNLSPCNAGDLGSIPELGRSPRGGHVNPLQYSCLENPYGQRSLVVYSSRGRKELDMTEHLRIELKEFFM